MDQIESMPHDNVRGDADAADKVTETDDLSSPIKYAIAAHPFFSHTRRKYLDILAFGATEIDAPAGEVIFHEGEPANNFYLILSGKISLEAHDPGNGTAHIQDLGPGEVLGWSWLLPPFAWHFSARTLEPTKLIVLRGGHLLVTAEENPDFGYHLMKRIAQVVIQRLQATRKELLAAQVHSAPKRLESN